MLHQQIDVLFGLDRRGHVVVVGNRHALIRAPFAESGELAAVGLDLILVETRAHGQRRSAVALDGATRLAIDDAGRVGRLEQLHLRGDAVLLFIDVANQQATGEPAAADAHAVLPQDGLKHRRVHREAAAGLHAGEAGLAGLPQALLQRDVVAQFGEVIVPPGDRRDAKLGSHLLLQS